MDKSYSKLVDIAYNMHVSGKLDEALDVYNKLLSINPDDLNVKNLYAQLNVSKKNYDIALQIFNEIYEKTNLQDIKINIAQIYLMKNMYKSAIDILKDFPEDNKSVLNILSVSYLNEKEYDKAKACYKKLVKLIPNDYRNFYNISICEKYLNNIEESLKYALKAFEINSTDIDIILNIALIYEAQNDINNAILYLEKVNELKVDENILYHIGVLYKKTGNYIKAVSYFDKVIQLNPNNKNAMLNIASTYKFIDMANALEIYQDINKIYPDDLTVYFQIYSIYYEMLDFKNALNISIELINKNPNEYIYYLMAGDCYLELYEYNSAIEYYKKSLDFVPDNVQVKESLAKAYYSNGDLKLADNILSDINSDCYTYTFIHLKLRNLQKVLTGFYKWCTNLRPVDYGKNKARSFFYKLNLDKKYSITEEEFTSLGLQTKTSNSNLILNFSKKNAQLDSDITNKNILIYTMHGVGDFIMFSRYIKILENKVQNILLYVPKSIERIVKYNFPNIQVFVANENVPESLYDISMPELLTLCYSGTDLMNIPYSKGYLSVPDDKIKEKSKLNIFQNKKKKVGIFWQGNPTILLNRSVKLAEFIPLFDIPNIQIYSFQISKIDDESEKIKKTLSLIDLSSYIRDYTDTAIFLKNIDILVTIDTSIAHLAGAMGIKTFLLLPYDSEWRWFTDEEKTPWYDSIKIFKQKEPNNWKDVIQRVKNEI